MHYKWNEGGLIYHKANAGEENVDHFVFGDNLNFYTDKIAENFENTWASTDESVSENERLFLLGIDFAGAEPDINEILKIANNEIKDKSFELSSLQDYIDGLKADIDIDSLNTVYGELRDGPAPACSGNGLAARMYIKRKNKKVQNKLIYGAEPLMTSMMMLGNDYDTAFASLAWAYLLKAHPHDSINGVTQDKTAEDVMYHLAQAEEITDILYQRGMRNYIRSLDLSAYNKNDLLLVVYNPLAFDREEIIKVSADVPSELNAWDLAVYDENGNRVEIQPVEIRELWASVHDPATFASSMPVDRHIFYLKTGVIPAGGCRVYKIEAERTFERSFVCGLMYSETSLGKEIAKTDTSMENEYLLFEVNPNGTVRITDKENNRIYDGMHIFEDTGEVGDYWINLAPNNNRIYTSIGSNPLSKDLTGSTICFAPFGF